MKIKFQSVLLIVLITLFIVNISGCATTRIGADYDHEVNFKSLKTFGWLPAAADDASKDKVRNAILEKRFKRALEAEMTGKGFVFNEDAPDMFVSFQVLASQKEDVHYRYYGRFDSGFYNRGYGWGVGFPLYEDRYTYDYLEATIVVDIINAKNRDLIWRGWKPTVIDGPSIPENKIIAAVSSILTLFPPL